VAKKKRPAAKKPAEPKPEHVALRAEAADAVRKQAPDLADDLEAGKLRVAAAPRAMRRKAKEAREAAEALEATAESLEAVKDAFPQRLREQRRKEAAKLREAKAKKARLAKARKAATRKQKQEDRKLLAEIKRDRKSGFFI
jgi:hypothetical protein